MSFRVLSVILALPLTLLAAPTRTPNFQCSDSEGASYKIWIGEDQNLMEITEQGHAREIALAGANLFRTTLPNGPLVYDQWNPNGKDEYSGVDMTNEFISQYTNRGGKTAVAVLIVVDHKEKRLRSCKTSGLAASIILPQELGSTWQRSAALIQEISQLRSQVGTLQPLGVVGVEAAIRRYFNSPDSKDKAARGKFLEAAGSSINNIDPSSIARIRKRLPTPIASFWDALLTDTRYTYYPEVSRFSAWVKAGTQPPPRRDLGSVIAGFNQFVSSRGYKDKDVRAFFAKEVIPGLKALSEKEIEGIRLLLNDPGPTYLLQLWAPAVGKRTVADFPDIERFKTEVAGLIGAKELDPHALQEKIGACLRWSVAHGEEAQKFLAEALRPLVQKLTARQREDVTGWFESDSEKNFFLRLL